MLVATPSRVYGLRTGEQAPAVRWMAESPVRRVAEGAQYDVAAHADGDLVILVNAERCHVATGISEPIESLLILHEQPLEVLIGTEAPQLYRLVGGREDAARNESLANLPVRGRWYTPWGGPAALRSMARTGDGWVYADIHVGSIMRSADRGETWEPVTPTLHEDVHQVATCPVAPERVYANTFRAVYLSDDRGRSWVHRADDLGGRYGRAIVAHPQDPDCLLATVSDGPRGANVHGQLYRTDNAGQTWTQAAGEFPAATRQNIDTFHVAFDAQGDAWAVVEATLYRSTDRGASWTTFWTAPEPILMVSCRL